MTYTGICYSVEFSSVNSDFLVFAKKDCCFFQQPRTDVMLGIPKAFVQINTSHSDRLQQKKVRNLVNLYVGYTEGDVDPLNPDLLGPGFMYQVSTVPYISGIL